MNPLAVITGGSRGIGRALVERFLAGGFDVVTCARTAESLETLTREMTERFPTQRLWTHTVDPSQADDVAQLVAAIHSLDRPVEVLVNNTGTFIPGHLHNEPEGVLEHTIETNLYSAYRLTRGLIGRMMAEKRGYIVMMCSVASITPYTSGSAYSVSKYALYGLTKVLREEMKPHGIKVTAILPGATLTDSWMGAGLPAERFMKAEDIADIIWASCQLSQGAVVEDILLRPQLGDIV